MSDQDMATMKCHSNTGKCGLNPKCEYACSLRVQPLLQDAHKAGWDECMEAWADHMRGMVWAIRKGSKPSASTVARVDAWFSKNTGLGGCSEKDVSELAAIFRGD